MVAYCFLTSYSRLSLSDRDRLHGDDQFGQSIRLEAEVSKARSMRPMLGCFIFAILWAAAIRVSSCPISVSMTSCWRNALTRSSSFCSPLRGMNAIEGTFDHFTECIVKRVHGGPYA